MPHTAPTPAAPADPAALLPQPPAAAKSGGNPNLGLAARCDARTIHGNYGANARALNRSRLTLLRISRVDIALDRHQAHLPPAFAARLCGYPPHLMPPPRPRGGITTAEDRAHAPRGRRLARALARRPHQPLIQPPRGFGGDQDRLVTGHTRHARTPHRPSFECRRWPSFACRLRPMNRVSTAKTRSTAPFKPFLTNPEPPAAPAQNRNSTFPRIYPLNPERPTAPAQNPNSTFPRINPLNPEPPTAPAQNPNSTFPRINPLNPEPPHGTRTKPQFHVSPNQPFEPRAAHGTRAKPQFLISPNLPFEPRANGKTRLDRAVQTIPY